MVWLISRGSQHGGPILRPEELPAADSEQGPHKPGPLKLLVLGCRNAVLLHDERNNEAISGALYGPQRSFERVQRGEAFLPLPYCDH